MRIKKLLLLILSNMAAISIVGGIALANEPNIPNEEWDSNSAEDSEGPVCYLYIYPRKQNQLEFARGTPVVFLSFNSLDPEKSEFSADLGRSSVLPNAAQLVIADKSFDLIFKSGKAWLRNIKNEPEVLQLFKTTKKFSIRLKYTDETVYDEYSSERFPTALEELGRDCNMKS